MLKILLLTVFQNIFAECFKLCDESIVKDSIGFSWLNYCNEDNSTVLFYKDYTKGWTFVTDKDDGISEYSYRIPYNALKCNGFDVDTENYIWENWCVNDKKLTFFQENGKFVIDKISGEEKFGWRRPAYFKNKEYSSFLEMNSNSECIDLEGDISGRFFPVEYDERGEKVLFQKDILGNYIIDPINKQRISISSMKKIRRKENLPLCYCNNLFELDPSKEFYWVIEFNRELPIVFIDSLETYYFINPNTGLRQIHH